MLDLIAQRLPATLQLAVAATLVGLAARHPGRGRRARCARAPGSTALLSGWSALALGVPTFWLGILLILLFAVELRWLPSASGYVPFWESPLAGAAQHRCCRR